jgi:hypothetical protein
MSQKSSDNKQLFKKCRSLAEIDSQEFGIILAKPIGTNKQGYTYTGFKHWNDAIELIKTGDGICEVIKGLCKPYIDYEKYIRPTFDTTSIFDIVDNVPILKNDVTPLQNRVAQDMSIKNNVDNVTIGKSAIMMFLCGDECNDISQNECEILKKGFELKQKKYENEIIKCLASYIKDALLKLNMNVNYENIKVMSSSGWVYEPRKKETYGSDIIYKISIHIVVNSKYCFRNPTCARSMIDTMKKYAPIRDLEILNYIDINVYKHVQNFRCIHNKKYKNDIRILKPVYDDNVTLCDYLITHIKDGYECVDIERDIIPGDNTDIDGEYVKHDNIFDNIERYKNVVLKMNSPVDNKYYTDIIYTCVNKILPSCSFYKKYQIDNGSSYYIFKYNNDVDKCPYGHKHDRQNIFTFVHEETHKIYIGCYSEKCKKNKKKCIGDIYDTSFFDIKNKNVFTFDNVYISEHKGAMKHVKKFINSDVKVLCVKSKYGTGKTELIKNILRKGKFKTLLWISHRQLYAYDIMRKFKKEFNIECYLENDKCIEIHDKPRIIISPESMFKIYSNDKFLKYDLVIIDESESVISQFHSTTIKSDKITNFYEIYDKILNPADKIICMDSDLDTKTITMIKDYSHTVLHNTYHDRENKKKFMIIDNTLKKGRCKNNEVYFMKKIYEKIYDDKKICIVTMSAGKGQILRDTLKLKYPKLRIMYHYSGGDDINKNGLKDGVNEFWINYDIVIYSPQIGAGIDFNVNHFDSLFLFISSSDSQRGCLQMINRIRKHTDMNIFCLLDKNISLSLSSSLVTLNDAIHYYEHIKTTPEIRQDREIDNIANGIIKIKKTEIKKYEKYNELFYHHIVEDHNKHPERYLTYFKMLVEKNNYIFEMHNIDDVIEKEFKKTKRIKTLNNKCDGLYLSNSEYIALLDLHDHTEKEKLQMREYYIINKLLRVKWVHPAIVDIYKKCERRVKNLMFLLNNEFEYKHDLDKWNEDRELVKKNKLLDTCKLLGLDIWDDKKVILEDTALLDNLTFDKNTRMSFNLRRVGDNISYLRSMLNVYGFKLRKNSTVKRTGDKTKRHSDSGYILKRDDNMFKILKIIHKTHKLNYPLNVTKILDIYNLSSDDITFRDTVKNKSMFVKANTSKYHGQQLACNLPSDDINIERDSEIDIIDNVIEFEPDDPYISQQVKLLQRDNISAKNDIKMFNDICSKIDIYMNKCEHTKHVGVKKISTRRTNY